MKTSLFYSWRILKSPWISLELLAFPEQWNLEICSSIISEETRTAISSWQRSWIQIFKGLMRGWRPTRKCLKTTSTPWTYSLKFKAFWRREFYHFWVVYDCKLLNFWLSAVVDTPKKLQLNLVNTYSNWAITKASWFLQFGGGQEEPTLIILRLLLDMLGMRTCVTCIPFSSPEPLVSRPRDQETTSSGDKNACIQSLSSEPALPSFSGQR